VPVERATLDRRASPARIRTTDRRGDPHVLNDPLPMSPSAPGCAFSARAAAGQWRTCEGAPEWSAVWTCPRTRQRWRTYACAAHRDQLDDPHPLDDPDRAELADRQAHWAAALAGQGWWPPQPMEPE
jgi:hypothetical protein